MRKLTYALVVSMFITIWKTNTMVRSNNITISNKNMNSSIKITIPLVMKSRRTLLKRTKNLWRWMIDTALMLTGHLNLRPNLTTKMISIIGILNKSKLKKAGFKAHWKRLLLRILMREKQGLKYLQIQSSVFRNRQ